MPQVVATVAELYVVGEPAANGIETTAAGFYSLEEMDPIEGVQGISRWRVRHAVSPLPGRGLGLDDNRADHRWQMFGLSDIDPRHWRS